MLGWFARTLMVVVGVCRMRRRSRRIPALRGDQRYYCRLVVERASVLLPSSGMRYNVPLLLSLWRGLASSRSVSRSLNFLAKPEAVAHLRPVFQ